MTELNADAFATDFDNTVARRDDTQFLAQPLPDLKTAKQAVAEGNGDFEDRFVLLADFTLRQQWEQAYEQLKLLEALAPDRQGMKWVRAMVHQVAGRRDDVKQQLEEWVPLIVALGDDAAGPSIAAADADLFLANHLLSIAYPITSWPEYGEFVAGLKPVYERQADRPVAMEDWGNKQLSVLDSVGRSAEALELAKQMAVDVPGAPQRQIIYAERLANFSRVEDEFAFLREQLGKDHWDAGEVDRIRTYYADRLENRGEIAVLLPFLEEWIAEQPESRSPYERYLSALVLSDDIEAADATVQEWLDLVVAEGELSAVDVARVESAIRYCLGRGHRIRRYKRHGPEVAAAVAESRRGLRASGRSVGGREPIRQ